MHLLVGCTRHQVIVYTSTCCLPPLPHRISSHMPTPSSRNTSARWWPCQKSGHHAHTLITSLQKAVHPCTQTYTRAKLAMAYMSIQANMYVVSLTCMHLHCICALTHTCMRCRSHTQHVNSAVVLSAVKVIMRMMDYAPGDELVKVCVCVRARASSERWNVG